MFKLKTRKAALKRYKKTGNKKIVYNHAYKGHLLSKKTNKQKRYLSTSSCVTNADKKSIQLMLPY